MLENSWQPNADIKTLHARAKSINSIRTFFSDRNVLEVDTPILNSATVTDVHLHSLTTQCHFPNKKQAQTYYLQTSPEFYMKRLLAAGSGAIYQVCKSFRDHELGSLHQPEFTMLEWYQPGYNHHQLMDEVDDLLQLILHCESAERLTYQDVFQKYLDINPHTITLEKLINLSAQHNIKLTRNNDPEIIIKDNYLMLLMNDIIEPNLGIDRPTFIYHYPESQAALARLTKENNITVAERFEVYVNGIELANGYHELIDPQEQHRRFENDIELRQKLDLPIPPIDTKFLAALESGLPPCAGVALGIDRLIMLALGQKTISNAISFINQ